MSKIKQKGNTLLSKTEICYELHIDLVRGQGHNKQKLEVLWGNSRMIPPAKKKSSLEYFSRIENDGHYLLKCSINNNFSIQ